jgi:hypothetical protein
MPEQPSRSVTVPAPRLAPWIDNFSSRHGEPSTAVTADEVRLVSPDGAEAVITVPFPPLSVADDPMASLLAHVSTERRVGAILVRKGGFAVGVFDGSRLVTSKVGSSYVQGKTKAGGWSQQRYARRRDNQSRKAYEEAADEAVRVLLPELTGLAAVVTGGDKPAIAAVLADPRLAALRPLVQDRVHPVADPRLRVLAAFPEQFRAVTIRLNELA